MLLGEPELRRHLGAAGRHELDLGGLVPHHVVRAEVAQHEQHPEGVGHGVERPAVLRPHVVGGEPVLAQAHGDVAEVLADRRDVDAGAQEWRPEVHEPPHGLGRPEEGGEVGVGAREASGQRHGQTLPTHR